MHEAFFGALERMLDFGVSVVVDKSWVPGVSEPNVRQSLLARATPAYVHCVASDPTERLVTRIRQRHPGLGEEFYGMCRTRAVAAYPTSCEPMDLDIPLLTVSTDDGYEPAFVEIVQFMRAALNGTGGQRAG